MVTSDTTLTIQFDFLDFYNTRWLSFGAQFDMVNQLFGIQISNAVDEEPLIHFEDFQDMLLIKAQAQSDFDNNHSFGLEFGLTSMAYISRTTIQYNYVNFRKKQLQLHDINLTSRIKYIRNTRLIFRTGYQHYENRGRFGLGLGLEQKIGKIHIGANSRYYSDYFHHEAYMEFRLIKKRMLTMRMLYNRIDHHDFVTIGLNYAFIRNQ